MQRMIDAAKHDEDARIELIRHASRYNMPKVVLDQYRPGDISSLFHMRALARAVNSIGIKPDYWLGATNRLRHGYYCVMQPHAAVCILFASITGSMIVNPQAVSELARLVGLHNWHVSTALRVTWADIIMVLHDRDYAIQSSSATRSFYGSPSAWFAVETTHLLVHKLDIEVNVRYSTGVNNGSNHHRLQIQVERLWDE